MPAPLITALPVAPSRANNGATFSTKADAFVAALPEFVSDANAQAMYLDALALAVDADRIQTGLDRIQTGLDRTQTGLDRVQTGLDRTSATESALVASNNAAAALISEQNTFASFLGTQQLLEEGGAFKVFANYAEALAGLSGLIDGMIIKVLTDETMGDRTTFYQVDLADPVSLDLDFTSETYAIGSAQNTLIFARVQDFSRVATAPLTSTSPGFQGDYFADANFFYYCYAPDSWRRIAGVTF